MRKLLLIFAVIFGLSTNVFAQFYAGYSPNILVENDDELVLEFKGIVDTLLAAIGNDTLVSGAFDLSGYDADGAYTFSYSMIDSAFISGGGPDIDFILLRDELFVTGSPIIGDSLAIGTTDTGPVWVGKTLGSIRAEEYRLSVIATASAGDSTYFYVRLRFHKKDNNN